MCTLMDRIEYEEVGDIELDDETSARLDGAVAQAESEFPTSEFPLGKQPT